MTKPNTTLNKHCKALELDKVLAMLADLAGCPETKQLALALTPSQTLAEAQRQLLLTGDANALTNRFGTPTISHIQPCDSAVKRARVGAMLSRRELLDVAYILRTTRSLLAWHRQAGDVVTALAPLFEGLQAHRDLEDEVTLCISPEEEVLDTASTELADIRRKIHRAQQRVREQLDKLIRSSTQQKYLQEQIVTMRNDRFVVPVKAEHRGEIKGIVHDTSASGSTLFVEPMGVVEANNQIRELESQEQHEINRILLALSAQVGSIADDLLTNYDLLIQLDLCFAKSRLADRMRATVPTLVETGETNLKKARHPLIPDDKIVPIDIYLGGDFDTLVVTGPNTGGKTVALKTLGLMTLMTLCGLMIPCQEHSTVCFYQHVLADIGDEQSIEQSLSTFSGHMTNIVSILQVADNRTLVLMDELGAGTDPVEGAALAIAIIGQLREQGAKIAASTHYAEIKMFALQTPGVENASCEFDVATLRPTYRLLIGVPGRSNAFAISQRLGLPLDIIQRAKEQISQENTRFEDVVSGLESARQQLEKERELAEHYRKQADEAKKQAESLHNSILQDSEKEMQRARDKARSLVEQLRYQSEELLAELEEMKKHKDKADFSSTVTDAKSTLRAYIRDMEDKANPVKKAAPSQYRLPRQLKRGDRVFLVDFGTNGTVLAPPDSGGKVQVQAGIVKTKVAVSALRLVEEKEKVSLEGGSVNVRSAIKTAKQNVRTEVDLRGMDSTEAILTLERYLDTAVLSGIKTVSIIHGKGTGVLRSAVQQKLRTHRGVANFRIGAYGEGDSGVTVAELK